jgi:adenine phosphoribosyltransferase
MRDLKHFIEEVIDFPTRGINFKDITPLLSNAHAFSLSISELSNLIEDKFSICNIAGIEARGFIIGAAVANEYGMGFIPIRKEGKLPPPKVATYSTKEYGSDILEVKENPNDHKNIVIVDDVLATGGTLKAAESLLNNAGYSVKGAVTLIDLTYLHSSDYTIGGKPVYSLIQY